MTDLERFFHRLVQNLSAADRARLQEPIPLAEIRGSIVPYRTNRRALQLETSEDYELVLMRLCAGEGGFVSITPEEVRARLAQESASPNPDLNLLRQYGDALVSLVPGRGVAAAVATMDTIAGPTTHDAASGLLDPLSPVSETRVEVTPRPNDEAAKTTKNAASASTTAPGLRCLACNEVLPGGRPVKFCPYCGQSQIPARCTACGTELEASWRFCASCGQRA